MLWTVAPTSPSLQALAHAVRTLEQVKRPGFLYSHPKLQKLEEVVLDHFSSFCGEGGSHQKPAETGVMIFSQYKKSVQEISDMMSRHAPLVKAMTFVGHSSGKSTSKGLTQKEQTQVSQYTSQVVK